METNFNQAQQSITAEAANQEQLQQQQQQLQPHWFNLTYGIPQQVLGHISYLTNNFSLLNEQFRSWLIGRVSYRQFTTFGYLDAPTDVDVVKQVIGHEGFYFKLTTSNTDIDFIWHDRTQNRFLFWGPKYNVIQAMKIIQSRINKYSSA
jgi:hypothetical protein